jgi:WhiB family redox-sensing transcriptional regulator
MKSETRRWSVNVTSNVQWMDEGLCRPHPPKYWYPSGTPTEVGVQLEHGKRICAKCPVRPECLEYALAHEAYGTWGGFDETERELYRAEHDLPLLMTAKDRHKNPKLRHL